MATAIRFKISVPLLNPVEAIWHELDIAASRAVDPDGAPTTGFDPDYHEPYRWDKSDNTLGDSRVYRTEVLVPCQVEIKSFEEVNQEYHGDTPITNIVLVFHRQDLRDLGLLNVDGRPKIKTGDKITGFKQDGVAVGPVLKDGPLYIVELRPASWGFGIDGHDLEVAYTMTRPAAAG